ncbi:MAG: hypothetical protein DRJ05_03840 [Bacteroidetes bacterium]|nr:MAG: hypothetical protein DRJ05_03840 [Bacteroidota bacterium]
MSKSENTETLRSHIIACCADGKVSAQEYEYLKNESDKYRFSENKLKKEIHITLLNMGKDKKARNDIKSCVIFTKEALKYDPKNKETLKILNEAVDALPEEDLLDLARTTINGFEIYKTILFEKIKEKGNDYNSKADPPEDKSAKNTEKAIEYYSVATEIKPSDQDTTNKLNQLLGLSGFVVLEEDQGDTGEHEVSFLPGMFKNINLFIKGGMAEIYTATLNDHNSRWHERKIVIKKIRPDKKDNTLYRKLFIKEYNILRDLEHENILRIIRKGEDEDGQYYISEFINGRNLDQLIDAKIGLIKKDGKRKRLAQILSGILHGMQGIHEDNIIHRDIKPANIMITNTANKVKIIDFGLAKTDVYSDKLKEAGTRPYISPEQRQYAYKADNRSDIFSFGVVMLELISGWKEKENANKLPSCLPNLTGIIEKCTQEKANDRYNYISEIIEEFSKPEVQAELKICGEKTIEEIEKDDAKPKSESKAKTVKEKDNKEKTQKKPNRIVLIIMIALILGVGGFLAYKYIPISGSNKINPESIEFSSVPGETQVVEIKSSDEWSIESDLDWLSVEKGNGTVQLKTLSENNTFESKAGVFNIVFGDKTTKPVSVAQLGIIPKLKAKPNSITLGNQIGQSGNIEIKSNLNWTVETHDNWIGLDISEGKKNETLVITATSINETADVREGKVIIVGVEKRKEEIVYVTQPGTADSPVEVEEIKVKPKATADKWTFDDLNGFVENIRGTDAAIDFDEIYKHIDPKCEVYFYINGDKMNSEDVTTFINKIKFGGFEKLVSNTVKYNDMGKIIEFGQE